MGTIAQRRDGTPVAVGVFIIWVSGLRGWARRYVYIIWVKLICCDIYMYGLIYMIVVYRGDSITYCQ